MHTTVSIPGMHCDACTKLIASVGSDVPGVLATSADLSTKRVTIEHDDSFDLPAWTKEVESLGDAYRVQIQSE